MASPSLPPPVSSGFYDQSNNKKLPQTLRRTVNDFDSKFKNSTPMTPSPTVQKSADLREFPEFSLSKLLSTVFEPTFGRKICILIDLPDLAEAKDMAFTESFAKLSRTGKRQGKLAAT